MDLRASQETFKNHRKIFQSLQDISKLVKRQESYLGHLDFRNHTKIFESLQDIPGLVNLKESCLGSFGNPGDF